MERTRVVTRVRGLGAGRIAATALAGLALLLGACAPAAPASPTAAKPTAAAGQAQAAKPTAAAKKVSLTSAYTSTSGAFAPLWTAKDAGYFDEEGLDVSLTRIQAGAPILAAMQGGDAPLTFVGGQQIVEANLKGAEFVMLAFYNDTLAGLAIYVHSSIQTPEQLRGKALGVTNFGSLSHLAGRVGVEQMGLKDQVTFLATGGPPETIAAMQAGTVQGGVLSPPNTLTARKLGFREMFDVAKLKLPSVSSGVAATRRYVRENPDVVERFLRATIKGSHRFKTDKEFGLKVLGNYSGTTDREALEETYDYYSAILVPDGYPDLKAIAGNLKDADEAGIPEAKTAKPEDFVDASFVQKIRDSGLVRQLYGR